LTGETETETFVLCFGDLDLSVTRFWTKIVRLGSPCLQSSEEDIDGLYKGILFSQEIEAIPVQSFSVVVPNFLIGATLDLEKSKYILASDFK